MNKIIKVYKDVIKDGLFKCELVLPDKKIIYWLNQDKIDDLSDIINVSYSYENIINKYMEFQGNCQGNI